MDELATAALTDIIRREGVRSSTERYIVDMWRHALTHPQDHAEFAAQRHALPYLPVQPEDYGVTLTESSRVLDVGCLGGYGIYDFAYRRRASGRPVPGIVGVDIDPVSLRFAAELARTWAAADTVCFCRTRGDVLAFSAGTFDVLIARLVIPYLQIDAALDEFVRVVRPGGLLFIQIHSPVYYWQQLFRSVRTPRKMAYYVRPLLAHGYMRGLGRQPRNRWFRETALDVRTLLRQGRTRGMTPLWRGGDAARPMMLFARP